MCIILLIRKHHGEAVPVLINLSSPFVPKLCVPNFRAWIPAYEEIVRLHRVLGFCPHLVSSALVAAVLDSYTVPLRACLKSLRGLCRMGIWASITAPATFGHQAWRKGSSNSQFFRHLGASTE